MVPCGFNTLVPALVFKLRIFASYTIGPLATGGVWSNGNAVGVLTSLPTYDIGLNATTIHMDDFFLGEGGGPWILDPRGLLQTDDGQFISVTATGLVDNTNHSRAILTNTTREPTQWGEVQGLTTWSFKASTGKYSDLTTSTFVANMRWWPSDNENTSSIIDYRISKVLPGPLCNDD